MKSRSLLVAVTAGAALLAACGSSSTNSASTQPASTQPAATQPASTQPAAPYPAATAAPASSEAPPSSGEAVPAKTATTPLGTILVTDKGLTIYAFTPDAAGKPTCTGGCAQAWPPVMVKDANLPAGLDAKLFSVYEGPEGSYQLKAGKWPLYTFSGDAAPGQTNGQGTAAKWYVVSPTGALIKS
jgi:predicted lipoprotein with Yx(FWY)xxD motif